MSFRIVTISIVLILAGLAQNAPEPAVVLGVLEDVPGYDAANPGYRTVRVAFKKVGNDWRAYPSDCPDEACLKSLGAKYPAAMTWTVAFDGKDIGHVSSRIPANAELYSSAGQQEITSPGPVPTIGERSADFGTFLVDTAYRPLVAVSRPYFQDPDVWKPAHLSVSRLAFARQQFRKKYPKLCQEDEKPDPGLRPYPYRDQEIKPGKIYSSRSGWWLVELRIKAEDCDDRRGNFLDNQWFVINPQGSANNLGEGMWLVDAGDYDHDGKSEVVFCIDQYNLGGYKLFYDDFKKQSVFQFRYH